MPTIAIFGLPDAFRTAGEAIAGINVEPKLFDIEVGVAYEEAINPFCLRVLHNAASAFDAIGKIAMLLACAKPAR